MLLLMERTTLDLACSKIETTRSKRLFAEVTFMILFFVFFHQFSLGLNQAHLVDELESVRDQDQRFISGVDRLQYKHYQTGEVHYSCKWRPQGDRLRPSMAFALRAAAPSKNAILHFCRTPGFFIPADWKVISQVKSGRSLGKNGVPKGIRTPVIAVKGRCPRPLDDGDLKQGSGRSRFRIAPTQFRLVEVSGIEPLTSCMPCKRSPS